MANYVLVHGAWGGNHTWGDVPACWRPKGTASSTAPFPASAPGRTNCIRASRLSDHVEDVCHQIAEARIGRFILAGHSYGGMVISGVASRMGRHIEAICYIDAFLPESDQSLWDITGEFEHNWYIDSQRHQPGYVTPIGSLDFEHVPGVVGFHPLLTLLEAIPFTGHEKAIAKKSYSTPRATSRPLSRVSPRRPRRKGGTTTKPTPITSSCRTIPLRQ